MNCRVYRTCSCCSIYLYLAWASLFLACQLVSTKGQQQSAAHKGAHRTISRRRRRKAGQIFFYARMDDKTARVQGTAHLSLEFPHIDPYQRMSCLAQALTFDVVKEARQALSVRCKNRTSEQLRVLSRWTRNVPLLSQLSESGRIELAKVLEHQPLYGGFILAKKGDGSSYVYIIFSGSGAVLRSKEVHIQRLLSVNACCGELPLLDPNLDTPTVFVPDNGTRDVVTEVVRIARDDFLRIVAPVQKPVLRSRMDMIRRLLFSQNSQEWSDQRIAEVSSVLETRAMKVGEKIITQGKPCKSVFFVGSGKCNMSRNTNISRCNSWPTQHYSNGYILGNRELGFPCAEREVGKTVAVNFSSPGGHP